MNPESFTTPVAIFLSSNSSIAAKTFAILRSIAPATLFLLLKESDKKTCSAVDAQINWPCRYQMFSSDPQVSPVKQTAAGLDWVFTQAEECILLTENQLPNSVFFRFCQELLAKYREDQRIMSISGSNFFPNNRRMKYDYYFSSFPFLTAWGTWQRVWKNCYDPAMRLWPVIRDGNWLSDLFCNIEVLAENKQLKIVISDEFDMANAWKKRFDNIYNGVEDNVTIRFLFSSLLQNGLHIHPTVKLVANDNDNPLTFPLLHPPFVIRNALADKYNESIFFN